MLLEMLFAMSCRDIDNQQACEKAMEAGSKQYEVYQTWNKAENIVKAKVTSATGETAWVVAAVGYKTYKDKAVTYSFQPNVFVHKITTKVGYAHGGTGSVNLEWRF